MTFNVDYRKYTEPCVVKLHFGNRYLVLKCKNLKTTISIFNHNLKLYLRHRSIADDNLFCHSVKYISRQNISSGSVELILKTDNQYQLLVEEQNQLDAAAQDKNCLNNNFDAYIPEWDEDKQSYGWLSKAAVMNFKKYLSSCSA